MTTTTPDTSLDARIDEFVRRTREMNGREIVEREAWNTSATADAIRHFAYGTSDGNPLWLNPVRNIGAGGVLAPPAFLCSVLYPFLHGAPIDVPLSSLIAKVTFEWFHHVHEGDALRASSRQIGVTDTFDRRGRRTILIDAETRYWNQHDELVAIALGTMARIARTEGDLFLNRDIYRYDDRERSAIQKALEIETRLGATTRSAAAVWVGQTTPVFVRGPLAVGDLICWQAAIGPSYRAGALGYHDVVRAPHHRSTNPVTGWPVKYSQQHEDFLMAAERGMPAPFDNSLMRFAWIAPMLTDWIGDQGRLRRLSVQTDAPLIYGDTTWYRAIVTGKHRREDDDGVAVTLRITGVNQLGQITTSGEAEVVLPGSRARSTAPGPSANDRERARIPRLIPSFAASRPDSVAVECAGRTISFRELDRQTARAAAALSALGAEPGAPVILVLDRSLDAIVSILSALAAGCAYVPVDVADWTTKLEPVLSTLAPRLVIVPPDRVDAVSARVREIAPGDTCVVATLESVLHHPASSESLDEPADSEGDDQAYVMPTSGSSGTSRLVGVTRRSLSTYLQSLPPALGVSETDVFVHTAAFTFSASVRQMFVPLSIGARLVVAGDEERLDPVALFRLIGSRGITVWDTVPSVWRNAIDALELLAEPDRKVLLQNALRLILTTGESLPWSTPHRWRHDLGHEARCINLYSQTETAGTVCAYPVPIDGGSTVGAVPIGKPLPSLRVDLLDDSLMPVADGEVGEICVSGPRLAAGYVGRSDLTAERFALRPFHHDGFYRTGDLGRRRSDGILEFVGRRDARVKIRGQAVDLADVEAALRALPGIADAVVTVSDETGIPCLVAHVVASAGGPIHTAAVIGALRGTLTEAALPSVVIAIAAIPRGTAGKVDRAALPLPAARESLPADPADATLMERVSRVFADALTMIRVGEDDNFFELGGNSLMATLVITRLRSTFGVDLPMLPFFEQPTIRQMAHLIEDRLLDELEAMSDEDASRLLDEDSPL